ncbi:MAG TPA: non-homologous end-joining DNA ligase [Vicinamibacterales bacterium]|nr:non-homologous end-joining DNA ligase [Vicinamibacterales bacterium]
MKYEPQLAALAKRPPAGDSWLHEIKYDGYRMGCAIAPDGVRLTSRNGLDYTSALPELVAEAKTLPVTSALLDGEVVVLLEDGRASFQALQQAMSESPRAGLKTGGYVRGGLAYLVFDLLHLNGESLMEQPLEARKDRLRELLGGGAKRIRYSDHVIGHGDAFFAQATKLGVEGIVSKRRDGTCQPGRRSGWLKIKCLREQPFVVGGYTDQEGMVGGLGALLVGHYENGRLTFAGRVGTGFTQKISSGLLERLRPLARRTSPFDPPPAGPLARTAHFVEPALVCRVAFAEWTDDDKIRHPVYRGLAEDIDPRGVARDFTGSLTL